MTSQSTRAFAPGATRAANGDILVVYNSDGDGIAGAASYLTRSTNDGSTWSTPTTVGPTSHRWANGSFNATLGLSTLADGTLLLPMTDSVNHTQYTDRESVTYVGRSTDHGNTWTGFTTPIVLPIPMYYNATYGRIIQLPSGTLLMPVWSAVEPPSSPGGLQNPTPWQAGVMRSFDNGQTWTSYSPIGVDSVSPPSFSNVNGKFPSNVTETSIVRLNDGRLLAVMRSDSFLGTGQRWFYQAYSLDEGVTWTDPVATNVVGDGHDVAHAPCTASLSGGRSKLIMGNNDLSTHGLVTRVSFDGGVNWTHPTSLQVPAGGVAGYSIYPNFVPMSGNRLFVVYGRVPTSGGNTQLAYNILQDSSGTDCQAQADTADGNASTNLAIYVERRDKTGWPWPYARRQLTYSSSTLVATVASGAGPALSCGAAGISLYKNGSLLNPSQTLAQAGVRSGDILMLGGTPLSGDVQVGFADFDTFPAHRQIYGWNTVCDSRFGFDFRSRSIGVRAALKPGQAITGVSLRSEGSTTRLTAADYTVWSSADGRSWTQVSGWSLQSTVVSNRLTHSFTGLNLMQPFVKINQAKTDTAFTFVIGSTRGDVTVTRTP